MTVQAAIPLVAKILLKAQDEMREKKMEIELSVLSEQTNWSHRILDRATTEKLTADTLALIENEDEEMN
jgi:hypothetical protein